MRHLSLVALAVLIPGVALLSGCGETKVDRTSANAVRDLSGKWNATDSRETAEALIAKALASPWADDFTKQHNRKPVVKVGEIKVRVDEVVNTEIFTDDLITALVNSGKAKAVSATSDSAQARQERKEQDVNASEQTRKESFQEIGADFLILGTISAQNDQEANKQQKFYAISLKLTDIKTQELVGIFNHKIAKDVDRADWK